VGTQEKENVYEMRISSLKNRGVITGRVILLRDITQSKRAQQERDRAHAHALEALRVKSRILAMVSHDFRTPLSAISGYCDMLQHGVMGPVTDKQVQALQRIQFSTGQLTNLVTNLLDQAKIDEGEITINWGRFKPADLIDGIETVMRQKAQTKGIKLITVVATPPDTLLFGDMPRVIQVTNNIVDNALKFTEEGSVTVRVYQHNPDTWGIEVTDTGPGMDSEVMDHIFDPFWQADGTVTRAHSGVGLGLSIARQLLQMMGGRIEVQSKVDVGTTFYIILPFHSVKETRLEKVSSPGR
jgi:signal transduction histidine kinase